MQRFLWGNTRDEMELGRGEMQVKSENGHGVAQFACALALDLSIGGGSMGAGQGR